MSKANPELEENKEYFKKHVALEESDIPNIKVFTLRNNDGNPSQWVTYYNDRIWIAEIGYVADTLINLDQKEMDQLKGIFNLVR